MVLVLEELCVSQDRIKSSSFPEGNGGALRCKEGFVRCTDLSLGECMLGVFMPSD